MEVTLVVCLSDIRRCRRLSEIAPRIDRFDKNDRRETLDHRAHHRREPDRAAAEDRDTRSRRTGERVHHPARARLETAAERPEQFERDLRRSEEHTSELQSLMRISYAVFCLKKKNKQRSTTTTQESTHTTQMKTTQITST